MMTFKSGKHGRFYIFSITKYFLIHETISKVVERIRTGNAFIYYLLNKLEKEGVQLKSAANKEKAKRYAFLGIKQPLYTPRHIEPLKC